MDELQPAKAPAPIVINTLRKMEQPNHALVGVHNHYGVILGFSKSQNFTVEKVPMKRIQHMLERGYILERRHTLFGELGWIEYDLAYDGMEAIRNAPR